MKTLKKTFFALALSVVTSAAFAQVDVTDKYLVNPSFEYSAEGTASTAKDLNGTTTYYGWTLPTLGTQWSNKSIGTSRECNGQALGISAASEGTCYFFNRQGWGTNSSSLSQKATLPAGKYFITVDYKAYERTTTNGTLGFSINGSSVLSVKPYTPSSSNAIAKNDPWKTVGAWFTVEADGEVTIAIDETLVGNSARADLYLDNVRLYQWDLNDNKNLVSATPETPLNITAEYVKNPYFDSGIQDWSFWKEDWATAPQNHNAANNKDGAISGKFFENWDKNSYKSSIYQIAENVPAGKYRLQAAAFGNNATSETDKLYVYLNGSKTYVTSSTPSFYTVETALGSDGSLDFGIRNEYSASNWIGIDNVELYLLEVKPISLGNPTLSMAATEDVDPGKDVKVNVSFPDIKALNADAAIANYDITVEYQLLKGNEVITTGTVTAAKNAPIVITLPESLIESKSKYTLKVVSAKDSYSQDYDAATYADAKISFTTTATEFEKTQLAFQERIDEAKETLANAVIGVNPFQYLPAKAKQLEEVIAEAESKLAKITTTVELYEAIEEFDFLVTEFQPTLPKVNEKFLIRHKASGLYLNLADGVKISASGTPVSLHRTEADTWYIYNTPKREYVGYAGQNKWDMTNARNDDFEITAESYNIHYIKGENGYLATDATAESASVYGDKGKNGNGQWFIEYYVVAPLENLDFESDDAVTQNVCGYGKDMTKNNTTLYGAQPVKGWTNASVGDNGDSNYPDCGVVAATFEFGSSPKLCGNNISAPAESYDGKGKNCLGLFAVWSCKTYYIQKTELPAGTYTLSVPVYNGGGETPFKENFIGFIASDGTKYVSSRTTYPVGKWTLEQITFTLNEDTEGVLSIGYLADAKGSAAMPHLFIDYVNLTAGSANAGDSSAEATAISSVDAASVSTIYSVDGSSRQSIQKGLNIVKMSNGQVKKVLVK